MSLGRLKFIYFSLAGLNSFAATYFFYYLFFYLHEQFKFGNARNLAVCALHGLIYTFSAWYGGRYSQRAGYFVALPLGTGIMGASLVAASLLNSVAGLLGCLAVWSFGVCFTWPTLEALVSEGEPPARLQRMIGIYNLVWAGAAALAYFIGGTLKEALGARSIFWVPALLYGLQMAVIYWVKQRVPALTGRADVASPAGEGAPEFRQAHLTVSPQAFLVMAWLANPFAYVAINAAAPVFPELAERLRLTTQEAGFFCSIWFFARLATFAWLWQWRGWHYRFRWLILAFILMIGSFAVMLLARPLVVVAVAQIIFGCAVGLIYYSSLFYSMDVGETKGEHGGIHEAAIGSGIFGGAAIGSAGQYWFGGPSSSTWAVGAVLLLGLGGLLWIRRRFGLQRKSRTRPAPAEPGSWQNLGPPPDG
jgi:predicted MFS family arabinose efflux permease